MSPPHSSSVMVHTMNSKYKRAAIITNPDTLYSARLLQISN